MGAAFDPYLSHWADIAARRTIAAHPDVETYVVAAGITPSGVVHVGNFREVMTVDLVARALRDHGKKVRFIYSWDDFDVFRKVPSDMPQQEMLTANLRRSIADVPDPFGEHDSYASHNIHAFQDSLAPLGIEPEFIRQSQAYRAGNYAEGIQRALANRDAIAAILNAHRKTPLADDWLPISGFCDGCGSDDVALTWDGEWMVGHRCRACGHEGETDLRKGGNVKLPWRVDWPMRWAYEQVCFEPGGKDHSSAGGSYDTGKEIVALYDFQAPEYVAYDFVRIKGGGGKISSSTGGAVTVADCLKVYEPEVLRWIFASYRANSEFQISFDLDVLKLYEDYDNAVRLAHQADDGGKKDKKRAVARRTLQLASPTGHRVQGGDPTPATISFRPLSMTLQIFEGDVARTVEHYAAAGAITSEDERTRLASRAARVWHWIEHFAPEEFCYRIRTEPVARPVDGDARVLLQRLVEALAARPDMDEPALIEIIKALPEGTEMKRADFFPVVYDLLLDRPKGPKLSTLLITMGLTRAHDLLAPSLSAAS